MLTRFKEGLLAVSVLTTRVTCSAIKTALGADVLLPRRRLAVNHTSLTILHRLSHRRQQQTTKHRFHFHHYQYHFTRRLVFGGCSSWFLLLSAVCYLLYVSYLAFFFFHESLPVSLSHFVRWIDTRLLLYITLLILRVRHEIVVASLLMFIRAYLRCLYLLVACFSLVIGYPRVSRFIYHLYLLFFSLAYDCKVGFNGHTNWLILWLA